MPTFSRVLEREERRYFRHYGRLLDLRQAWWTPPLSPREAWELETNQIARVLGLKPLVSLTDHDDLEGNIRLRVLTDSADAPVSLEWTVPYRSTFFHLGIHDIPPGDAHAVMGALAAFTARAEERQLPDLLRWLHESEQTLIVLNHPLWDERGIGSAAHLAILLTLIRSHREWLHALELNGLRSQNENREVMRLAQDLNMTLISGGDRHGLEPNAALNLTRTASFDQFVGEIRTDRVSHVIFLNQYREPFRFRLMQGLLDVVRDYPELPAGRRRWTDRVFFRSGDGGVKRLSALWEDEGPRSVKLFMAGVRLLQSRQVRGALRFAFARRRGEVAT